MLKCYRSRSAPLMTLRSGCGASRLGGGPQLMIGVVFLTSSSTVLSPGQKVRTNLAQKWAPGVNEAVGDARISKLKKSYLPPAVTKGLCSLGLEGDACSHHICIIIRHTESYLLMNDEGHLFVRIWDLRQFQGSTKPLLISSSRSLRSKRPYNSDFNLGELYHEASGPCF